MTIKKLSKKEFNEKRSRFETELQNGDRDIVTPILDKMDTFAAFSYLFRRFGTPTFNADNESNNLFEYAFLVNGVLITIHGSYKEFVYVRAYISKEALDAFKQKVYSFRKSLVKRLHAEGIPFVQGLVLPQDAVPKDKSQENVRLWHEKASSYLTPEALSRMKQIMRPGERTQEDMKFLVNKLMETNYRIEKDFIEPLLTKEEKALFRPILNEGNFPREAGMLRDFCRTLLEPVSVRDVDFNIKGYL